jgi:hypothetical protein
MREVAVNRRAVAERGKRLEYFTIAWNSLEGLVALIAGAFAGSISLVGFGIDSFIEDTSGGTLLWRMSVDAEVQNRERNEKLSLGIVGVCFLAPQHSGNYSGLCFSCGDAGSVSGKEEGRQRSRKHSHARGRETDGFLCILVRHSASRPSRERRIGMAVGGPNRCIGHGSHHCQGRNRWNEGPDLLLKVIPVMCGGKASGFAIRLRPCSRFGG